MTQQTVLNIGCGSNKLLGAVNVDAYGDPDVKHDLNVVPWPFADNSVDKIIAHHVFEHLTDWWGALKECCRILRVDGTLDMRVPHESSTTAIGYRDHLHVITLYSFFGTEWKKTPGTNAWAKNQPILPLQLNGYYMVPFRKYEWMARWCPWLLLFCADHFRNFIWEQRFLFKKTKEYAV